MRGQKRNHKDIYYALYSSSSAKVDEYGNETSEVDIVLASPVKIEASVSEADGSVKVESFGNIADYNKLIIVFDMSCPISETSVLWIDETDTSKSYDYIVKKVAKCLNHIIIAAMKVSVSDV